MCVCVCVRVWRKGGSCACDLIRIHPHSMVDRQRVVPKQDAPPAGLDVLQHRNQTHRSLVEWQRQCKERQCLSEPTCSMIAAACVGVSPTPRRLFDMWSLRTTSSLSVSSFPARRFASFCEFSAIEVPTKPGMQRKAVRCGALTRKSPISASVNPLTANLADE